jgi:hypothetical protein
MEEKEREKEEIRGGWQEDGGREEKGGGELRVGEKGAKMKKKGLEMEGCDRMIVRGR